MYFIFDLTKVKCIQWFSGSQEKNKKRLATSRPSSWHFLVTSFPPPPLLPHSRFILSFLQFWSIFYALLHHPQLPVHYFLPSFTNTLCTFPPLLSPSLRPPPSHYDTFLPHFSPLHPLYHLFVPFSGYVTLYPALLSLISASCRACHSWPTCLPPFAVWIFLLAFNPS